MLINTEQLLDEIRRLAPWHMDIQLTEDLSTGMAFGATSLEREQNQGVSLISPRESFSRYVAKVFGGSLNGKSFLDCACNAGAYCFLRVNSAPTGALDSTCGNIGSTKQSSSWPTAK